MLVWGIDTPSYKLENPYNYSEKLMHHSQKANSFVVIYLLKLQYKNAVFRNTQKFEFVFVKLYRN
nr:MAG TPA: hypothetical protein [Bacteriophage sp.]